MKKRGGSLDVSSYLMFVANTVSMVKRRSEVPGQNFKREEPVLLQNHFGYVITRIMEAGRGLIVKG